MGELKPPGKTPDVSKTKLMLQPRLSAEQNSFRRTHRCVKCGKRMLNPAYSMPDGTPVSPYTLGGLRQLYYFGPLGLLLQFKDKETRATCSRCGHSWNVYALAQPSMSAQGGLAINQIIETVRTEEPIGDELRKIDNSSTSTSSVRRLRATRRWAKKCDVQMERASTTTHGLDLAVRDLGGYHSAIEAAVKQNYAVGTEEEETFDEEIEVTVPPRTSVQLCLHWKRLWQEGYVVLTGSSDQTVHVPFRTIIGVTFDQESVDA